MEYSTTLYQEQTKMSSDFSLTLWTSFEKPLNPFYPKPEHRDCLAGEMERAVFGNICILRSVKKEYVCCWTVLNCKRACNLENRKNNILMFSKWLIFKKCFQTQLLKMGYWTSFFCIIIFSLLLEVKNNSHFQQQTIKKF